MIKLLLLLALIFNFSACTTVAPISGALYTETTAGLAGSGKMGSKKGMACMKSIVGVALGDVSVAAAAKDGGITRISHVDNTVRNILGVYTEYCTIVYGF